MDAATLLLPAVSRLGGPLPPVVAKALGRADRSRTIAVGERAQLLRHFSLLPADWAIAAITRQADAGDAGASGWLRADPAWVRPEMTGARLFATGEGLGVTQEDVEALLPSLEPLFADAGFELDAPSPSRWYLRLPAATRLPVFADPDQALGAELSEDLPDQKVDPSVVRRWRALLNDAQILLHTHPHNQRRIASGRPPINSLWFWGGGCLPDAIRTRHTQVRSDEATLTALATVAGATATHRGDAFEPLEGESLVDLRELRDLAALSQRWLAPAIDALLHRQLASLTFDLADGPQYIARSPQRWRVWRRPLQRLDAAPVQDDARST